MTSVLNFNSFPNNMFYILPIYILSQSDMGQLLSFIAGIITGSYLAQNYNIPDVKTKLFELKNQIENIEEKHKKDK